MMFGTPITENIRSRVISHIDLDYFYAQCEEVRNPGLKNHPIVVCVYSGRDNDSGVVSTSNYNARHLGVTSGISIKLAKSKLSKRDLDPVFLPVDLDYYRGFSTVAMEIIKATCDTFEQVGVDECYIDISRASDSNFMKSREIANHIQNKILSRTSLTCSIGVAPNKLIAKIASNIRKPNAITIVSPPEVMAFMRSCKIEEIPGIGPKKKIRLETLGIRSVKELSEIDLFRLKEVFGYKIASYLQNAANGINDSPVKPNHQNKQIGNIVTLKHDITNTEDAIPVLMSLCTHVYDILIRREQSYRTVSLILILHNLNQVSASRTLKLLSSSLDKLQQIVMVLLVDMIRVHSLSFNDIRRIGIALADLAGHSGQNKITRYFAGGTKV
jgi:DNA polymerase IV (DinB-like DNA polymerase)